MTWAQISDQQRDVLGACDVPTRSRRLCTERGQISGQHREEYLARFAAHDALLTLDDLTAACRLVMEMRAARGDDFGLYNRRINGVGPDARGVLVFARQTNYFDALGRLTQVIVALVGAMARAERRVLGAQTPPWAAHLDLFAP